MFSVILHKGRTPWSAIRAFITRRCQFKGDAVTTAETPEKRNGILDTVDAQITRTPWSPDIHVAPTIKRDTPCCSDTDLIVNQLAMLAASVSQSSTSTTTRSQGSSTASLVTTAKTQSTPSSTKDEQMAEEESFHYLRSLITISCLPHHSSGHLSVPSTTHEAEASSPGRKRASSRLSIRLGDLQVPGLSFPTKVSRKPCPRYTTLPPTYSSKHIIVRPEVRF